MTISSHLSQTQSQYARIVTCDPTTRKVEVVGNDRSIIQVAVTSNDNAFRWPIVGETWSIYRDGYDWYLGKMITPAVESSIRLENFQPGDMILNSSNIYDASGNSLTSPASSEPGTQISIQTALPPNPNEGDLIFFQPDPTNPSVLWQLRCNRYFNWDFIGGSELLAFDAATINVTSASYAKVGTLTLPIVAPGTYRAKLWIEGDLDSGVGASIPAGTNVTISQGAAVIIRDVNTESNSSIFELSISAATTLYVASEITSGGTLRSIYRTLSLAPLSIG